MNEADIQRLVMIELSRLGAVVWRNNTGAYKANERYVRYGLCVGSSDIIGMYQGRFLAVEVKQPKKKPTQEQQRFINTVNENGGIAFVACCVEDVKKNLTNL